MHVALVSEHVSPLLDAGGVATQQSAAQLADLASALTRIGAEVDVFTRKQDSAFDDELVTPDGYRVVNVCAGPTRTLAEEELIPHTSAFASALRDHWSRRRPDVAHAHSWVSGLATELAAGAVGVPTVVSFHGLADGPVSASKNASVPRAALERKIARSADRIVASSSYEADNLTRLGVARAKVSIVPSGVDLEDFDPSGPAAAGGQAAHRIAAVGQGSDMRTLIDILGKIKGTELVVLGGDRRDTDEVARLREVAAAHGMTNRVVFTGPVRHRHMSAILRSADMFVCMSPDESAAIVTLEAMACGLPVVAHGPGCTADLVVDGITGRLIDPPSRKDLARDIDLLVRNEPRRFALGVSGADRAQSRFGWDRIAEDIARIYDGTARAVFTKLHPPPPIPAARRYAM